MSSASLPLDDELASKWDRILRDEGLAPLDERVRGRVVVRPRVSPGLSERTNRRKEFGKEYEWRSETAELCWAFYSNGVRPKDIAGILSCQPSWVKYTVRRVERARRRRVDVIADDSTNELGADVLQIFVDEAGRFAPPEPRTVKAYRRHAAINLWKGNTMSETVSDQDIAKMLGDEAPPHLEVVKSPESVGEAAPPEKTEDELEQEKFDAVVAGPFSPEALQAAAIETYKRRLPKWIENTKLEMKRNAARGAFVTELETHGIKNFAAGVVRALNSEGFGATAEGSRIVVPLVPNGAERIATGEI